MAAWSDMADDAYDRAEAYGQHVTDEAFYECSLEELCATISVATEDSLRLADELAAITRFEIPDAA